MILSYIDPGTGSMLISASIALVSVVFFMVKGVIYRKFNLSGEKGQVLDPNKHYGLVFYSEGKQYWNVFKPVVMECNRRGISLTFLTSDKQDPALELNLKGFEAIYIGSGREGYFSLNRLKADLVVMTTPGLDVLEIKRSKNVKHYTHLTHAPGCVAGYKSYALDYFDSVLIGGTGDVEIIKYIEKLRNLPEKKVEIVGHTYLDVYRDILEERNYDYSMFKEYRTTVLVSPTWSNHGLLTVYGEQLLRNLVDSNKYNIIIRPHPQSVLTEKEMLDKLIKKFPNSDNLIWDTEIENLRAMSHADIMISDFSGIIFDFFILFNKPILTVRSQYEKRGRDSIDLLEDPWDVQCLGDLGATLSAEDIENVVSVIDDTLLSDMSEKPVPVEVVSMFNMYPNESAVRGMNFIENTLQHLQEQENYSFLESKSIMKTSGSNTDYVAEISSDKDTLLANLLTSILNPNLFFQATIASVMLTMYIFIGLKIFPNNGLNYEFFSRLLPYSFLVIGINAVITILMVLFINGGEFNFSKKMEKIELSNFLLLAIPITPILVYVISNQDILSIGSSIYVIIYFIIVGSTVVVFLPWLLSSLLDKKFSIAIGIGFLFTVFNMASYGRATDSISIAIVLAFVISALFIVLFIRQKKMLTIIGIIFLIANLGVTILGRNQEGADSAEIEKNSESLISIFTKDKRPLKTPDVFILIYDSYSNQETMESYGYDNTVQVDYLLDEGFAIYDGTYSVGSSSLVSMARMIDAQSIKDGNEEARRLLAGGSSSFVSFKENGYVTQSVQTSDYMTKGFTPKHDFSFPDGRDSIGSHNIIIDAVIEGEFRFDTEFSKTTYSDYTEAKLKALSSNSKKPKFLYSHSDLPGHSQNSGVLRPDESERHFNGLDSANREMRNDIETIRKMNRDAIIIIAGDHGPYLTKNGIKLEGDYDITEVNALDIQDRFGTFLAISWPEKETYKKYDIKVIQDVIPAVISYIYDDATLFDKITMSHELISTSVISGANIENGIIIGGMDDGKPLFKINGIRTR